MIIEFAGLPKSGKSSSIAVVRDYFSRCGYRVRMVAEGARTCPFSNKNRIEFACWTANQALSLIMEARSSGERDTLIIQDRGLFDALAFLKLLHSEGYITKENHLDFSNYFANPRWVGLVDLVIFLSVSPERALERDLAAGLGTPPGVITNIETMQKLLLAYDFVLKRYGSDFPRIEQLDTIDAGPSEVARNAIRLIEETYSLTNPTKQVSGNHSLRAGQ